jgi:predicted DNA-binding ribbon-helix-helix protein
MTKHPYNSQLTTHDLKLKKHSVRISGHPTSITLEDEFWTALRTIAKRKNTTLTALIESIDQSRGNRNLSSAIRVYILENIK